MKDVEFRQGLPDVEELESCFLVLVDMMHHLESGVADLFTKGSHHRNISVIAVISLNHQFEHMLHGAVQESQRCQPDSIFSKTDVPQRCRIPCTNV